MSNCGITAAVALFRPRFGLAAELMDHRAAGLAARTIGIDAHNHVEAPLTETELPGPDIDLAREMRRSGLSAIGATFVTDRQPGDGYDRFLKGWSYIDGQLDRDGIKRSLTAADVRASHTSRKPAAIGSIEGAHFLQGRLGRVEEAYRMGLRHFGLLHDTDATVPLGDVYTRPPRFGGLTRFGADVVKECNRLGILIDLAHADLSTIKAALKVAREPVIISHTGPDWRLGDDPSMAQIMLPRLISKDEARMVADAGGVIGVWTHLTTSPLDYAHNLRALVDVIGVDHVCIGTDTKLVPVSPAADRFRPAQTDEHFGEGTDLVWAGQNEGFYFVVVDAMLKAGFTGEEIGKIGGGNYLRVFEVAVKG